MQMCKKHWDMLRKAIDDRGLTHLCAPNSEEAFRRMTEELAGEDAPFDPLISAHWMINGAALQQGGLYLMTGDYCPVCEAIRNTANRPIEPGGPPAGEAWVESHWIDGPADEILHRCREKGLAPAQQ